MAAKQYSIRITGRVQGVNFREFVRKHALQYNLTGYVRNAKEYVEILAQGEESQLKKLVEKCRRGPLLAKVDKVEVQEQPVTEVFEGFDFRF